MWKSQAGTLVRVLTSLRREPIELHALYPTRRSMSGKVRAFIDALIGHLDTVKLTSARLATVVRQASAKASIAAIDPTNKIMD